MIWKQKKRIFSIMATVIAIMLIITFAFVSCASSRKEEVVEVSEGPRLEYAGFIDYEVQCFDTLSLIACKFIPDDVPKEDFPEIMQEWISDVIELNGRSNSDIYYGETIKVFCYEE